MDSQTKTGRGFLNQDETLMAAYSHLVTFYPDNGKDNFYSQTTVDAEFRLSDCRKTITLDFQFATEEELKARLLKAKILLHAVEKFKRDLEEAAELFKQDTGKEKE